MDLTLILESHRKWLNDEEGGVRAILTNADLTGANLTESILTGANLTYANLRGANLRGANLTNAILTNANLRGAILTNAILTNAILRDANLRDANLTNAILRDANLRDANITNAENIYSFGPIGQTRRICYAVKHAEKVMFKIGCFWGDLEQAKEAIQKKYGENSLYEKQCILASEVLNVMDN